jgi:hypothetical protein
VTLDAGPGQGQIGLLEGLFDLRKVV